MKHIPIQKHVPKPYHHHKQKILTKREQTIYTVVEINNT